MSINDLTKPINFFLNESTLEQLIRDEKLLLRKPNRSEGENIVLEKVREFIKLKAPKEFCLNCMTKTPHLPTASKTNEYCFYCERRRR